MWTQLTEKELKQCNGGEKSVFIDFIDWIRELFV